MGEMTTKGPSAFLIVRSPAYLLCTFIYASILFTHCRNEVGLYVANVTCSLLRSSYFPHDARHWELKQAS